MSSEISYVSALDLNGHPIEPPEARKAFKHVYGFQVRDNVSITIQDWRLVPQTTKEQHLEEYNGEDQVFRWRR
jgi:hypothetical protein